MFRWSWKVVRTVLLWAHFSYMAVTWRLRVEDMRGLALHRRCSRSIANCTKIFSKKNSSSVLRLTMAPMDIILCRLSSSREKCTRENQAGFPPRPGCIDPIFILRQISEHKHVFHRPTICLWIWKQRLSPLIEQFCGADCHWGMWRTNLLYLSALCMNNQSQDRSYDLISPEH